MYVDDENHAKRWVKPKHQIVDDDGNAIGLLPQAFEMRPRDDGKLSVNWLEYFKSTHQENIEKSIQAFKQSMEQGIPKTSVFAIGNVGCLKQACTSLGHTKVEVDHNGKTKSPNPAHCSILRLPKNDLTLMQKLASEVFTELVPNRSTP